MHSSLLFKYGFRLAVVCVALSVRAGSPDPDWLIDGAPFKARLTERESGNELVLENGLVRRVFQLTPEVATVALDNLTTREAHVRSIKPEALLTINGIDYTVGGLAGQPVNNYLRREWLPLLKPFPGTFRCVNRRIGKIEPRFAWKRPATLAAQDLPWPPPGLHLAFDYEADADTLAFGKVAAERAATSPRGLKITVHYELYDGLPLFGKWITVRNAGDAPVEINKFTGEILGVTEAESTVEEKHAQPWILPQILPITDYAFGSMTGADAVRQSVHWESDPDYKTQVNYERKTPALLRVSPDIGPAQILAPGETFESFRTWLLLLDSRDRERAGLAERRMYRTLAPWIAENPIMMHVRHADEKAVRLAVDQCAEVGFEMVILTFGSGFNFESRDAAYQTRFKQLTEYAHEKRIALGGYSLLSSRSADPAADNCATPKAVHGVMPCLGAAWGRDYLAQLKNFTVRTGFDVLEHDGSYPGDTCASTAHPHHRGYGDSQWAQWKTITEYYRWCRANGVYLNIPDWYFLNGGSKCGMGYRESNWSLPRAEQEIIERQNIFDGTWTKTPSMGWMFVPLTQYQGGGAEATIEPLGEHLEHYETRLANLFGAGAQACYRGPRLYDSEKTKTVVKRWVDFYKTNRAILDSDLIHLRRADGRDWDGWLHVNPALATCGLAMLYNPLETEITRTVTLPLYYTGLTDHAGIRIGTGGTIGKHKLARDYSVQLEVTIPARGRVPVFIEK